MQSKDINQKSTERDTFPSTSFPFTSATQGHTGLYTVGENWSSFSVQYPEHFIEVLTGCGALSWQHCQTSMECSDQCSQCSDCCAPMVTACPVFPCAQCHRAGLQGLHQHHEQTLLDVSTTKEQDSKKQRGFYCH